MNQLIIGILLGYIMGGTLGVYATDIGEMIDRWIKWIKK
jgi:hypothetical protein